MLWISKYVSSEYSENYTESSRSHLPIVLWLAWHYFTVYYVHSLQLNKPLFYFWYKFKPNRIKARGVQSDYYSSYLYASKYIVLQYFGLSMDVVNLTQYETYLKIIPNTIRIMKLQYKVPLY